MMEIGIDSFASRFDTETGTPASDSKAMEQLLDRIEHADRCGLDVFGIGEHHKKGFLDAAPTLILAAAASRTKKIKLTSAVTVLSAADPVRVFQNFATLDLISGGRAEMVVGRGSFIDAFPLFGYDLKDYDAVFKEKLDLLLKIREQEEITWSGEFRPPLKDQPVFPRPMQQPFPIWLGVGGTPESFVRAGTLGLPLMVAVIGGLTHHFRPLVDLYRAAGAKAGHHPETLKVGLHSLAYIARSTQEAIDDFYPGYAKSMDTIGQERGWPPMTEQQFYEQMGPEGALLVGSVEDIAAKIRHHAQALGGITRLTFQMDTAKLTQQKYMQAIELIGTGIKPLFIGA